MPMGKGFSIGDRVTFIGKAEGPGKAAPGERGVITNFVPSPGRPGFSDLEVAMTQGYKATGPVTSWEHSSDSAQSSPWLLVLVALAAAAGGYWWWSKRKGGGAA